MQNQARKNTKRKNLTEHLISDLKSKILMGRFPPGSQLPTEQGLIRQYGVSQTVVRESIAALSAQGLVEPRHGVGVFVLMPPEPETGPNLFIVDPNKVSSILEALELRAGVEIEAAGLAAERRSPSQEIKITEAFERLRAAVEEGRAATVGDLEFHAAIAEATNNTLFKNFLEYVHDKTKNRSATMGHGADAAKELHQTDYFVREHREILRAIINRDAQAARQAMRRHLDNSRQRFQKLNRSKVLG